MTQSGSLIATAWVFASMKTQLQEGVLSSLHFLLLRPSVRPGNPATVANQAHQHSSVGPWLLHSLLLVEQRGLLAAWGVILSSVLSVSTWDSFIALHWPAQLSTYAHHGSNAMTTSGCQSLRTQSSSWNFCTFSRLPVERHKCYFPNHTYSY